MSPKSRGRPVRRKARRTPGATATTTALSLERRALREARALLHPGANVVAAELFASFFLGQACARAELGDREPELALVRGVAEVVRRADPAGAAALAAFRLVLPEAAAEIDELLDELGQPLPGWAAATTPAPAAALLSEDPWGARQNWFIRYDEPSPHVLMASVMRPGGPEVDELTIALPEAPERYDEIRAEAFSPLADVPVGQALAALREAVRSTGMMWPRSRSGSFVENRLLARRRIDAHADPEPSLEELFAEQPLPPEERSRLRAAFLAEQTEPAEAIDFLVEVFLDYGAGYLGREPLRWSPADVILFLLDYVPRKVVLDEGDRTRLPALLADWVRFALARSGVEPRWIEPVLAAVQEHAEEFFETYADAAGPARQLLTRLTAEGVDLTDKDSVDAAVSRFNAEQLARRALAASGPPPGAAYQLKIVLHDVRTRVWRRVVVPADVTLDVLHEVVQVAMGWNDAHLHVWEIAGERYGASDPEWDVLEERTVAIADVCAEGETLDYTYDLGDNWEHAITVEGLLLPAEAGEVPRCEAGARACPPEDIGGAPGYAELLDALAKPGDASAWGRELAEMYDGFDPERFDAQQVTRGLRAVL